MSDMRDGVRHHKFSTSHRITDLLPPKRQVHIERMKPFKPRAKQGRSLDASEIDVLFPNTTRDRKPILSARY